MTFDGFVMAAVAAELRGEMGAFVDQVYQPGATELVFAFTGRGPRALWLCSADAQAARCHALSERPEMPAAPPAFCMLARKHLRGGRLEAVEQVGFDRVLRLTVNRSGERCVLVHEVMGRHSNSLLLDEAGTILGAIKIVPPSRSRARPVLPGKPYEPAPTGRRDPRPVTREEFLALAGEAPVAPEWFSRTFNGFGPFAAAEVLARAASPAPAEVWAAFEPLVTAVREERFAPVLFRDERGQPAGFWAFRSAQVGGERQEPAGGMSAAVDTVYGWREEAGAREALRKQVEGSLRRALGALQRQREEAERHLENLDGAEQWRIRGELLAGAGGRVPRGASQVELPNYYDPEQAPLRIELDPALTPAENVEQYFRRYRRAVGAAERAIERLPEVEAEVARLEALLRAAEAADDAALAALDERLRAGGLYRERQVPRDAPGSPTRELPPGIRIRRYHLEGWEVLWGENATSNDYLTTRVARPDDLWLHARAVTGAHVVVRGERRGVPVPRPVLEAAARTAAAHSDARHSSVVPVDYTQRRYVRKPRGSAPGLVTYQNEKTVHVSVEEAGEGARVE